MTSGLIACLVALAVAAAVGVAWRRSNGRMREPATASEQEAAPWLPGSSRREPQITVADLGKPLGSRATLLQFSTAFCAPCRATRRILAEVASMTDGVAHVEIDAESRLDLVRLLDVYRTPTVLVLDHDGRIAKRASGQPRKADVIAALGAVVIS